MYSNFHFIYYKQHSAIRHLTGCNIQQCIHYQWRSQDLEVGAQGVWGTEVPQRGPGADPLVGGSGVAQPPVSS